MVDDITRMLGISRFELFHRAYKASGAMYPGNSAFHALTRWRNGYELSPVVVQYLKKFQRDPPEGGDHG